MFKVIWRGFGIKLDSCSGMSDDFKSQIEISKPLFGAEEISRRILTIRGHRVMLDADIAELYGVTTTRLNEQVKRNRHRFPDDFMFRLNSTEKAEVVAKCDNLARLKFSPVLPIAFTEHGTIMAASVLNSKRAVETSVYVVRAFVRMREALAGHRDLSRRLDKMEKKYDAQFRVVFDAIRALMEPPKPSRRRIGF